METLLTMLKIDLGILTATVYDQRLTQLLNASFTAIVNEGAASLSLEDPLDQQLIVMYAGWLWRMRDFTLGTRQNVDMTSMPRSLRLALNNRVFRERAGEAHD